ncbi:HAMP domain-containing sensor histidine kinase [Gleimia hominis]|uniref:histidine kinase n=1 Tax=Gleimia hominis TaxID=595468 RepID=A0ABU3IBF5_9ACTO|nr:HAMP domain-containing sensor histidine kinase [Gleimia hominis]MDT3767712.1 HAMP domain-containing sensor histidine kinase [Gleimia hominis]
MVTNVLLVVTGFILGAACTLGVNRLLSSIIASPTLPPNRRRIRILHHSKHVPAQLDNSQILTHEIRTPLALIQGSLELIASNSSNFSEKQRQLWHTIDDNVSRISAMAEDFLTNQRLQSKNFQIQTQPLDLRQLVRASANELRLITDTPIEVTDPGQALRIRADKALLRQLVLNLLNNAVRHSGGAPVTVRTYQSPTHAIIEVADQGAGMTPHERERIVAPFVRAAPITDASATSTTSSFTSSPQGTARYITRAGYGLGMSIVQLIVERHGGQLRIDTLTGRGTLMQILLPRNPMNRRRWWNR